MTYNKEEKTEPFWAQFSNESGARDPLAIQNSNVVIYSKLVVGITNVTVRIRYNGFYCWIIDEYLHLYSHKYSREEQIKFIRRAELLLAFMMAKEFSEETGVSGISFAQKHLQNEINLAEGADWEFKISGKGNLYWNTKGGAFIQYFAGVMRQLNLIFHPSSNSVVYTLTEKGSQLAEVYRNSVKEEAKVFIDIIQGGKTNANMLSMLKSFAISSIDNKSNEYEMYKTIILNRDDNKLEPSYNRKETIRLILQHVKEYQEKNSYLSFLKTNYQIHAGKKIEDNTATYWYVYELNELTHLALEHIHAGFLYQLKEFPLPIAYFTNEMLKKIETILLSKFDKNEFNNLEELIDLVKGSNMDSYYLQSEINKDFNAGKSNEERLVDSMTNAVILFLKSYVDAKEVLNDLVQLMNLPKNNLLRTGNTIELFNAILILNLKSKVIDFLKDSFLYVINRHIHSSYTKSTIGQNLGHNYMMESNEVWKLRDNQPTRTSPRLQNLYRYIMDLKWIQKNEDSYQITGLGEKILAEL